MGREEGSAWSDVDLVPAAGDRADRDGRPVFALHEAPLPAPGRTVIRDGVDLDRAQLGIGPVAREGLPNFSSSLLT